jgi:hypothetical protein
MRRAPSRIQLARTTPSSSRSAKRVPALTNAGTWRSRRDSILRRSPPRAGRMLFAPRPTATVEKSLRVPIR